MHWLFWWHGGHGGHGPPCLEPALACVIWDWEKIMGFKKPIWGWFWEIHCTPPVKISWVYLTYYEMFALLPGFTAGYNAENNTEIFPIGSSWSLLEFEKCLDRALRHRIRFLGGPVWNWTWWPLWVPTNSGYSVILLWHNTVTISLKTQELLGQRCLTWGASADVPASCQRKREQFCKGIMHGDVVLGCPGSCAEWEPSWAAPLPENIEQAEH